MGRDEQAYSQKQAHRTSSAGTEAFNGLGKLNWDHKCPRCVKQVGLRFPGVSFSLTTIGMVYKAALLALAIATTSASAACWEGTISYLSGDSVVLEAGTSEPYTFLYTWPGEWATLFRTES